MTNLIVTMRSNDYHVYIEGHPELWGCGKTITQAIGDCIMNHSAKAGINIIEM